MVTNHDDRPRKESLVFFERVMSSHRKVLSFSQEADYYYVLNLVNGSKYYVVLTNLYTVGVADVVEFIGSYDVVDAIVTVSQWNGYTKDAKRYSQSIGVGLFLIDELMGALNYDHPELYYSDINRYGEKIYNGVRNK